MFTIFSIFGSHFILNCCLNPFIVHSRPRFCWNQISIYRWWFFVHRRNFNIDFLFFFKFFIWFFRKGFPISLIVRSTSNFLFSQWKFFEGLVPLCFFKFTLPFNHSVSNNSRFSRLTSDLLHSLFQMNGF